MDEIERKLQKIPHLSQSRSLISIYRQVHPLFNPESEDSQKEFRDFCLSTPFFNYQGLISPDRMMTIVLQLELEKPSDRREIVSALDEILLPFDKEADSPIHRIRKVGQPNLNVELDRSSYEIGVKFFPIYLFFAFAFLYFLYRSAKGLLAVLVSLAVTLAIAMGSVHICGSVLTLVSTVLPMMVLIVSIETMVHIYSGYVRPPEGADLHEHLINVLSRKWRACWFSVFTTSVGFGSFAVSEVMPIRDLGIFVSVSLIISFAICFTLFPAMLDLLQPPTGRKVRAIGLQVFDPVLAAIPTYSYWWRKSIVPVMTLLGLFGIWSFFQMEVETNSLNYLNKNNQLYKDTSFIEENLMGLMSMEIILEGTEGSFASPNSMRTLQGFEEEINKMKDVQSLLSASTLLRMANFIENGKDNFPVSNFAVSKYILAISQQKTWGSFVSENFDAMRLSAITKNVDYHVFDRLDVMIHNHWAAFQKQHPEFKDIKLTITGMAPLTANITRHLLDTLVGSFGLTLLVVFFVFWLVIGRFVFAFLSMLPSLFSIVLMYLAMTAWGVKLDMGSIMIAAVVLGISVDATIHFFQHYMVKLKSNASIEDSLQYSLVITGRAIVVSTIVIFAGFMTFSFSDFPPIKHFGLLTSVAMIFSLIGTLLYLPSCLWLLSSKEMPQHLRDYPQGDFRMLPPRPPAMNTIEDETE